MMPRNTNSSSLYDFLLQQIAAESYFDTADRYASNESTRFYLELGTNRAGEHFESAGSPNKDKMPGLTRLTTLQSEEFVRKFKIIDQWSDFPAGPRPMQLGDAGYLELNGQQILAKDHGVRS